MEKFPTVFIDRDGTINKEAGYINNIDNFEIYPFVAQAIKLFNYHKILVVVVTNQGGIAREYFPEELVVNIHKKLFETIDINGGKIDKIYYCPHYPKGKIEKYSFKCHCRKPETGMVERAIDELPVDIEKLYVVGDKFTDIELAFNINAKGILVKTGYGSGELEKYGCVEGKKPYSIQDNLLAAAYMILGDLKYK